MPEHAFANLGDRLTRALLTADFGEYSAIMALPLRIVPRGGADYVLSDLPALRRDFDLYASAIRAAQVTDIFRDVQEVRPETGGAWRVFCMVHIFVRAHRIADPFRSEMLLVPGVPSMRIAEIVSAAEHITWTLGGPAPGGSSAGLI